MAFDGNTPTDRVNERVPTQQGLKHAQGRLVAISTISLTRGFQHNKD